MAQFYDLRTIGNDEESCDPEIYCNADQDVVINILPRKDKDPITFLIMRRREAKALCDQMIKAIEEAFE